MAENRMRVIIESPFYDRVWKYGPKAQVADFISHIYEALGDSCEVGLRLNEPEFPKRIIEEFIEDGQHIPTRQTSVLRWPEKPEFVEMSYMQVRRVHRETFDHDILNPKDDQYITLSHELICMPLSDMGFQDMDTCIITFTNYLRNQIMTSLPSFTPTRKPEVVRVKKACPFAAWEAIELSLQFETNVDQVISQLQRQYDEARKNAALLRKKNDAVPDQAPALSRGKSVADYTSLENITIVRSAVSWASQQEVMDALRASGGDPELAIKSLSTGDPNVDSLLAMFPHVSVTDIQGCLQRVNGDVAMAASYLLDM